MYRTFICSFVCHAVPRLARLRGAMRRDFNTFLARWRATRKQRRFAHGHRHAFAGVTPDRRVLAFDRRQHGIFRKSFEHYAATRVIPARICAPRR